MAHNIPSWAVDGPAETPASPRTMRTLRKIRSHQVLTSSNALIAQTQSSQSSRSSGSRARENGSTGTPGIIARASSHRRARSNSDAATRAANLIGPAPTQRRPARKTGSGIGVKRSQLESLLRDGPQNGKGREGLQELKYLVLSCRVDADGDGMVSLVLAGSPFNLLLLWSFFFLTFLIIAVSIPNLLVASSSQHLSCSH
jgi:cell cycle arrest protein BUB2